MTKGNFKFFVIKYGNILLKTIEYWMASLRSHSLWRHLFIDLNGEEAKEMNEWISVKDRLPENDNPVLIILNTKDQSLIQQDLIRNNL